MEDKKYKIVVADNAFSETNRSLISGTKTAYTQKMAEMDEAVGELDRYDDFSMLKIDPENYKNTGGRYGIREIQGFNDGVIFPHQRRAALAFLKELRGFGLLADVVGSGKTFEACVVLSELAVRNKLHSLLLVVPGQVFETWKSVLEEKFGLGENVLLALDSNLDMTGLACDRVGDALRPLRPVIVRMEDFANWPEDSKKLLFDAIVVDEAHHLCTEHGRYAKAMKLLSLLLETKKKADMTYCLLLSATPHSGNLEHMFRLWYFIRRKGGNPSDFDEKEDKDRTQEYRDEKAYYKTRVCRGASTVMEFIKKVKISEIDQHYKDEFSDFVRNVPDFDKLTESEKYTYICEFLRDNEEINRRVIETVASEYHNGVLRSIMIRQPNGGLNKKKFVIDYLFFPMQQAPGVINTKDSSGNRIAIDCSDLYGKRAVQLDGEHYSLENYLEEVRGNRSYKQAYAEFVGSKVLNGLGYDEKFFSKAESGRYYWEQLSNLPADVEAKVVPYCCDGDRFTHKFAAAKEIIKKYADKRIIVFFDYDLRKEEQLAERFEAEIRKDKKLAERVISVGNTGKRQAEEKFNAMSNALLIVKDASFTESVNLQASNIIINFQVTPDPLAMDQRIGRIFRMGQSNDVYIYSFADMDRLEGYALMYFSRIGLMSSNSGDATIIAGSNNERMVTVRCPICKNVELYSLDDYSVKKKNGQLFCDKTERCRELGENERGAKMGEIAVYDFKCDTCDEVFTRSVSKEGYMCMSINNDDKGIMCNEGEKGDRDVYCRKICAIAHCRKFNSPEMEGKCAALKMYRERKNIGDPDLVLLCTQCPNRRKCPAKCHVTTGKNAVSGCSTCDEATCSPAPGVIRFDDKWEADCPICAARGKHGKLRPVVARTFAAYIRSAWNYEFDNGRMFCKNLSNEANKVADIKEILGMDGKN